MTTLPVGSAAGAAGEMSITLEDITALQVVGTALGDSQQFLVQMAGSIDIGSS